MKDVEAYTKNTPYFSNGVVFLNYVGVNNRLAEILIMNNGVLSCFIQEDNNEAVNKGLFLKDIFLNVDNNAYEASRNREVRDINVEAMQAYMFEVDVNIHSRHDISYRQNNFYNFIDHISK